MKEDPIVRLALRIVIGIGPFLGVIALFALFTGDLGAFFGIAVVGAGFAGLGWAGRRFMAPPEEQPRNTASTVAGVVFGGAGGVMVIGSIALFAQGEFGGAVGLAVFGLVFGGAGYAGYRVFREPEGQKRVLVTQAQQEFRGPLGQTGRRTSWTYRYVDVETGEAEVERMQQTWAEEPWTQRDDWAAGRLVQDGPGSMRLLIGFTIVWNVIAGGIAGLAIWSEWDSGDVPWFVLLFPLFGLALAVMTVRTWIRRRKFGISVLNLETVPAYLGERLLGTVETPIAARDEPPDGFLVTLLCAERRSYRDSDGDRHVSETKLWSDERTVRGRIYGSARQLAIPVDIAVPANLPATQMAPEDDRRLWRLYLTASTPGVDYAAQFEVPVFGRLPDQKLSASMRSLSD